MVNASSSSKFVDLEDFQVLLDLLGCTAADLAGQRPDTECICISKKDFINNIRDFSEGPEVMNVGSIRRFLVWQLVAIAAQPLTQNLQTTFDFTPNVQPPVHANWLDAQKTHAPTFLTQEQIRGIATASDPQRFMNILKRVAVPRQAGSAKLLQVQQFIIELMKRLGYSIELDTFTPTLPPGYKVDYMTNIIATMDPTAPRKLVLACHIDSKHDPKGEFVGATDSAVPCSMMIDLAAALHIRLATRSVKRDITLQLIFFDGEEAFEKWSSTDSLYGSRNLAEKLGKTVNSFDYTGQNISALASMDLMVLLDLIGSSDVQFRNFYYQNSAQFYRMLAAETSLDNLGLIKKWGRTTPYFDTTPLPAGKWVDDDYRPFLAKGVKILHMISLPFPSVWHKPEDNLANIHTPSIDDLNKILRVYVCEYLGCGF